ncbi:MAG: hypothetical protein WC706_07570 [Sideroxydans sp.]
MDIAGTRTTVNLSKLPPSAKADYCLSHPRTEVTLNVWLQSLAPLLAGALEVVLADSSAGRAHHFIASAPAQFLEQFKGFVVGEFHHLSYREGAGFGGE